MQKIKVILIPVFLLLIIWTGKLLYARTVDKKTENIEAYAFVYPKDIHHTPYEKICILGNKLFVTGEVIGVNELFLYYKKSSETNYKKKSLNLVSENQTSFNFEISASEVTLDGIDYYLKATNSTLKVLRFKYSKDNPYHLKVCQENSKEIGVSGGKVELIDGNPYDGLTSVEIPEKGINKSMNIILQQIDINNVPEGKGLANRKKPVAAYNFVPDRRVFNKPVIISLLYFDLNNDGFTELINGARTEVNEKNLGIFWWDGYDWRYIGGKINTQNNTVTAKIKHFSLYALFPTGKLTPDAFRPKERILTLNNDGINDYAHFGGASDDYIIKIFNIAGRQIRTIKGISEWDGKDDNGDYVESGAYIYQFKVSINGKKQIISGIIAIAK